MSQNQLACATPYNNDVRLSEYQMRVVEWMDNHRGLIAAFETGTGKTLTAIAVMNCFIKKNPGKPVVFVAPLSLLNNFTMQMKDKFGLDPKSPEVQKVLKTMTYETFNKRWLESIDEKGNFQPDCIDGLLIVDEAHKLRTELSSKKVEKKSDEVKQIEKKRESEVCEKCKSNNLSLSSVNEKGQKIKKILVSCIDCGFSKKRDQFLVDTSNIKEEYKQDFEGIQTLSLLNCAHKAKKVLLLTATPVYNNVYDINNLIAMIQGKLQPLSKPYYDKKIQDEQFFRDFFKCKISFHARNDDGTYPRRIERTEYFIMDPEYYELYFKIQSEQVEKTLVRQFGNPKSYNKFLQALRQSVNSIDREKSPKIEWITKELIKNHNNKIKSLVYSSFKDSGIVLIQNNMQKNSIPYGVVSGNVSEISRKSMVDKFNRGLTNILFITKAGGEGLDLKETEKVYILESGWNKQGDEQVIGRAIRRNSHKNLPPNRQVVEVIRLQMKKPEKIRNDDEIPLSVDENLYNFGYVSKQPKLDAFVDQLKKVSIEQFDECNKITDEEDSENADEIYASARKSVFMVPLSEIIEKRDIMKRNAEVVKAQQKEKAAKARILNQDVAELNEKFKDLDLEERIQAVYNEIVKKHPELKDDPNVSEDEATGQRKIQKLLSNIIARNKIFSTKTYRNVRERKIIEEFQKQREEKQKQEREKVTTEFNKEEEQLNQSLGDKGLSRKLRTKINDHLEQLILSEDGVTLESSSKDLTDKLFEKDKELREQELTMFDPVYEYVKRWKNKIGQFLKRQQETRRKEEEYTRAKERENVKRRQEEDRINRLKKDKQRRKLIGKEEKEEKEEKKSVKKITEVPRKKKRDIFSKEFLEEIMKKIKVDEEEPMRKGLRKTEEEEDEEPMRKGLRKTEEEEDEEPMRKGLRKTEEEEDEEPMRKGLRKTEEEEDEEPMRKPRKKSEEKEKEEEPMRKPSESDEESDDEYGKDMTAEEYEEMMNAIWSAKYKKEKGLRKKIAEEWGEKYEEIEEDVEVEPKKRKIRIGMCKVDDVVTFLKFLFHYYIVYPEESKDWVLEQIRALPEFAGCSEDQFQLVTIAIGNEMNEVWESGEISTIYDKALRALFRYWREEKMVDVYDRVRDLNTFVQVLSPVLSDLIIEDPDKMDQLYSDLQEDIMYCYILYDYLNIILNNPDAINDEDDEILEALAEDTPYYRFAEDEAMSLINDLNNFFNSSKSKTLKTSNFKRVISYVHLTTEHDTVDDMMDVLVALFRNMDESDMRKEVEVYFEAYNESQKQDCEYDEFVIAGGAFYTRFIQDLESFNTDNFREQLFEYFPVFQACTQTQITRGIELAKETIEISSIKEFLNKQDAIISIIVNSHLFGEIKTLESLFEIIEKIFTKINTKDLYKILTIVNNNLELGINEEFEIMLNHKVLLSENPNHRYDRFLEKVYSDKLTEDAYKVENDILYFSRNTEPSVSFIKTDVAGMYSILQAQLVVKPSVPCIFSFNPSVQEMRFTNEYSFLGDWMRLSELSPDEISLYKNFGGVLMTSLYNLRKFYNFQDVLESMFISKTKTNTYTFDLFGGQITFNIREILLLPTSWVPVIGELITPNYFDEDDMSISSIKRLVQSELFNEDGKIKSEFENNVSFSTGSNVISENLNFFENLKSLDKKHSNLLCKLQDNTVPSLYEPFCLENIPTSYFKVLVESVLFNKDTPYNLSHISQGIYKRLTSYFFKGQCNLTNSHRVISALLSNAYMNSGELIKTQGFLLNLVEQVTNNKRCELNGRYPSTLSQINAIKELGGLENVKKLIKEKFREIREVDIDRVLRLSDDLEIYTAMKDIHNKIPKIDEPQEKSDYYRSRARLNELREFINFINKEYKKNKKGDFLYLDYGGGEGGITKAISNALYLKKQNTFSLDIEDWYGNILAKPYQADVTYRIVKPFVKLPFTDDSVDVITCLQVLHHVHDLEYYLAELIRILKPNGYLVLREHDCNSELVRRLIDVEHMLFECVLNKDSKGNGRYLFEYKDSDGYKPISEWISILGKKGLVVDEEFTSIYQTVKSETRYVYRIFRKLEQEKRSEEVVEVQIEEEF